MEKVINYYYRDWRDHAVKLAVDLSNRAVAARVTFLRQYANELADKFHEHIIQQDYG